jgi:hypothetical protein
MREFLRDRLRLGNPLELPRGLTPQQLAGGFGFPGAIRLSGGIDESFRQRVRLLPEQTRRLLLIAAPPVEAGLAEFGTRVRFRHPVVRSVIYGSALPQERQEVHGALAGQFTPELTTGDGEGTEASTEQFLRDYMEAFGAFVTRVLTALPRVSCQEQGKPLSGFRVGCK